MINSVKFFLFLFLSISATTSVVFGLDCYFCHYSENDGWASLLEPTFGASNEDCMNNATLTPLLDALTIVHILEPGQRTQVDPKLLWSTSSDSLATLRLLQGTISQTGGDGNNHENMEEGLDSGVLHCVTASGRVNGGKFVMRLAVNLTADYNVYCSPYSTATVGDFTLTERDCYCTGNACNLVTITTFPITSGGGAQKFKFLWIPILIVTASIFFNFIE